MIVEIRTYLSSANRLLDFVIGMLGLRIQMKPNPDSGKVYTGVRVIGDGSYHFNRMNKADAEAILAILEELQSNIRSSLVEDRPYERWN